MDVQDAASMDVQASPMPHNVIPGQQEILDIVSHCRELGISADIEMPEIGVFGDQSSGKSSVLQAITKISFPVQDSLCNRFAIEFIMRHTTERAWSANIVPGEDRSEEEKKRLQHFSPPGQGAKDLGLIISSATEVMGIDGIQKNFSRDVLQVTICGPEMSNLTLIDLPGIFHGRGSGQTEQDAEQVQQLVRSYMMKPKTIMLAILSADHDLSGQIITKWIHETDPAGQRTMGIITKPDMLDEYPTRAKQYLEIAQNKILPFKLGWHILKNRKHSEQGLTQAQRDTLETTFLASGVWSDLPASNKGIDALVRRLIDLLQDHIVAEAAPLVRGFETALAETDQELQKTAAVTIASNTKADLTKLVGPFEQLVTGAISGQYVDKFFRNSALKGQRHVELRRLIEELVSNYHQSMKAAGHSYEIVEAPSDESNPHHDGYAPRQLTWATLMSDVTERLSMTPNVAGQFDPSLASDLFYEQSHPWAQLVQVLSSNIVQTAKAGLKEIIGSLGSPSLSEGVWHHIIEPELQSLERRLMSRIEQEMKCYTDRRPIMFSKSTLDQIPYARELELRRILAERVPLLFQAGGPLLQRQQSNTLSSATLVDRVISVLIQDIPVWRFTSAEIIHVSRDHYQVSLPKMLSKFDITNFDEWFLSKLPFVLTADSIASLSATQIDDISRGHSQVDEKRQALQKRRDRLQKILGVLHRLRGMNKKHNSGLSVGDQKSRKRSRPISPE